MEQQVLPLDQHTVSLLRSGVYLHSFTHALKSLLEVSIRSSATTISSSIDPATGTLCVDDNGVGLDMRLVNSFGRFNSNSLVSASSTDQSSGKGIPSYLLPSQHRVLDSLAHLSLLDICSRQEDAGHTHQTLFRDGQVIFSAPAKTSRRHNRGTTTTVRDLFHNLPVRQIREDDPTRYQQRLKRQWEECRLALQSLAIVYPHITFILRNSSHQTLAASNSPDSFYRLSKTGLSSSTFGKIFGQQFVHDSIPLNVSIDGFQVNGLFSKKRHSSRAIQLIYLDQVLIPSNSLVHRNLATLFAGSLSQDTSGSLIARTSSISSKAQTAAKNGASSIELHPIYLLLFTSIPNPSCGHEPDMKFIDEKEQYLIPQTEEKMSKVASRIFNQVFSSVKDTQTSSSGQKHFRQDSLVKRTLQSHWLVTKRPHLSNSSSRASPDVPPSISLADRFAAPRKNSFNRAAFETGQQKPGTSSKSSSRIEPRKSKRENLTESPHRRRTNPSPSHPVKSHPEKAPSFHSIMPDMKSRFEYQASSLSIRGSCEKADGRVERLSQTVSFQPQGGKKHQFDGVAIGSEESEFRIDLSQLANPSKFTVIGQLDLKFLIVTMGDHSRLRPDQKDGLIVAFDQHAVHERIRIERYLQEVCSGNFNVKELKIRIDPQKDGAYTREGDHCEDKYVPILVNRIEFDGLSKFKALFTRWGFIYELTLRSDTRKPINHSLEDDDNDEDGGFKQIFMRAVPELIWQRVQCNDGQYDFLKSILSGCLGFFEDRFRDQNISFLDHQSVVADTHSDWFRAVKDCPTPLVHLLNSKACRGSIMFGDKLTNKESRKLLIELGRTKLPFSCAHGRPTCYPLFRFGEHPPSSSPLVETNLSAIHTAEQHALPNTDRAALPPPSEEAAPPISPTLPLPSSLHSSFKSVHPFHARKIHWESLFSD
ncbi:hypothetical protein PCANC_07028 [Puccinia coronata f. sp. avenae]|uniref:MutL C-terminal dimerisation domain-containing protein n=1 Tax=Puccinia coronata f. sp. avenae TaxID=200324 RepID=A0A2N5VZL1_9BASI|nr:hypothetical protein PCANC_07028 [Puccinia coronata f. sp. avenae]